MNAEAIEIFPEDSEDEIWLFHLEGTKAISSPISRHLLHHLDLNLDLLACNLSILLH